MVSRFNIDTTAPAIPTPTVTSLAARTPQRVITQFVLSELMAVDPETGLTKAHLMAQKLVDSAVAGDAAAIKECLDRTEGRPKQVIAGDSDDPVEIIHRIILAHCEDDDEPLQLETTQ